MKIEHITDLAGEYGRHRNLCLSTLGCYAVNDGKFFDRLASGGGCTLRTAARLFQWFSDNWPDHEIAWPADIPRPTPNKKEAA